MTGSRPTRRRVRWIVAALLALALVAAACGGDGDGGGDDDAEADPNGVLRFGLNFQNFLTQDKFNPAQSTHGCEYTVLDYLYGTLLRLDVEGRELQPGLAERWRLVDAKTIDVTLRRGLTFHDGSPLDADALVASMQYHKAQSPTNPRYPQIWRRVDQITKVDDVTVRVTTTTNEAYTLQYEFTTNPGMPVHKSMIDGTGTTPIGAGPFMFESYTSGQVVQLKKFPGYYDADDILLGGLTFQNVDIGPPGLTALQSEAIDMMTADAQSIRQFEGNDSYGTDSKPGFTYSDVYLRWIGPTTNVKFRQALSTALPRDQINEAVQAGIGEVTVQPYPSDTPYYVASLKDKYKYDLDAAKRLLAESGVPANTTLEIVYPSSPGNVEQLRQAEIVQASWRALGLTVNLVPAPDTNAIISQYYTNASRHGFSATTVGSANPVAQVSGRFFSGQFVAQAQNSVMPQVQALYDQFQAGLGKDPSLVQRAVEMMVNEAAEIPIMFRSRNLVWSTERIGGSPEAPVEVCDSVELAGVFVKR